MPLVISGRLELLNLSKFVLLVLVGGNTWWTILFTFLRALASARVSGSGVPSLVLRLAFRSNHSLSGSLSIISACRAGLALLPWCTWLTRGMDEGFSGWGFCDGRALRSHFGVATSSLTFILRLFSLSGVRGTEGVLNLDFNKSVFLTFVVAVSLLDWGPTFTDFCSVGVLGFSTLAFLPSVVGTTNFLWFSIDSLAVFWGDFLLSQFISLIVGFDSLGLTVLSAGVMTSDSSWPFWRANIRLWGLPRGGGTFFLLGNTVGGSPGGAAWGTLGGSGWGSPDGSAVSDSVGDSVSAGELHAAPRGSSSSARGKITSFFSVFSRWRKTSSLSEIASSFHQSQQCLFL